LKGNRTEDTKLAKKRESTVAWLFGDGANWGIWNVEQDPEITVTQQATLMLR